MAGDCVGGRGGIFARAVRTYPCKAMRDYLHRFLVMVAAVLWFGLHGSGQPSPTGSAEADRRAQSILNQMTLEEKVDLIGGVDDFYLRGVPRLGVPRLKMADGPLGVRNDGPATAQAAGNPLAATWNPDLAEQVGREIGRDARAK